MPTDEKEQDRWASVPEFSVSAKRLRMQTRSASRNPTANAERGTLPCTFERTPPDSWHWYRNRDLGYWYRG
jgi:hypothetical protein